MQPELAPVEILTDREGRHYNVEWYGQYLPVEAQQLLAQELPQLSTDTLAEVNEAPPFVQFAGRQLAEKSNMELGIATRAVVKYVQNGQMGGVYDDVTGRGSGETSSLFVVLGEPKFFVLDPQEGSGLKTTLLPLLPGAVVRLYGLGPGEPGFGQILGSSYHQDWQTKAIEGYPTLSYANFFPPPWDQTYRNLMISGTATSSDISFHPPA